VDYSDIISMAAMRPPSGPPFPDRMINPVRLNSFFEIL